MSAIAKYLYLAAEVCRVYMHSTHVQYLMQCGRAVAQLTELSIKRQVSKGLPWLSNVLSSFGGPSLEMTDYPTAPPLVGKLPWEAQDAQQQDVALGADLIEL